MRYVSFERRQVPASGATINIAYGGAGSPVLLLHGFPQTLAMWHRVAPALAEQHTVVVSDLRGYGDSTKPASDPDHAAYSFRANRPGTSTRTSTRRWRPAITTGSS